MASLLALEIVYYKFAIRIRMWMINEGLMWGRKVVIFTLYTGRFREYRMQAFSFICGPDKLSKNANASALHKGLYRGLL